VDQPHRRLTAVDDRDALERPCAHHTRKCDTSVGARRRSALVGRAFPLTTSALPVWS
jgi:hypothetical protein